MFTRCFSTWSPPRRSVANPSPIGSCVIQNRQKMSRYCLKSLFPYSQNSNLLLCLLFKTHDLYKAAIDPPLAPPAIALPWPNSFPDHFYAPLCVTVKAARKEFREPPPAGSLETRTAGHSPHSSHRFVVCTVYAIYSPSAKASSTTSKDGCTSSPLPMKEETP
jgi:hypothetical protein